MNKVFLFDVDGFYSGHDFTQQGINYASSTSTPVPVESIGVGEEWKWTGSEWVKAIRPVASVERKYTQQEWIVWNGFTGYKILAATKSDPLAQYFHEVLKAEGVVSTGDSRLGIAYGYYVGAGYITQEEADRICGFVVESLSAEQVQQRMSGGV